MMAFLWVQLGGLLHLATVDHVILMSPEGGAHYGHKARNHTDHEQALHLCAVDGQEHQHDLCHQVLLTHDRPQITALPLPSFPLQAHVDQPLAQAKAAYHRLPLTYATKHSPPKHRSFL